MRRLISVGLAAALLLAAVPLALGLLQGLARGHGEAASSSLTCSVKTSCDGVGEVPVFRMSGPAPPANAHAGTFGGSPSYGNIVCCSGVTGLSESCSGSYDTVLWLYALTNAHVSETSGGGYSTQVCLAAASETVDCKYVTDSGCGTGYACLATISGTTNAHVADCDGTNDYVTKVCCKAEAGPACIDRDGDTTCRDPVNDTDDDGCTAAQEAALGANFSDANWYDVFDVPVPTNPDPTLNGARNRKVDMGDVLAVLFYAFAENNKDPNANGVDYDSLKGISPPHDAYLEAGVLFDRSPGELPVGGGVDPAGAPNGKVDMGDVLGALAQAFVVNCVASP